MASPNGARSTDQRQKDRYRRWWLDEEQQHQQRIDEPNVDGGLGRFFSHRLKHGSNQPVGRRARHLWTAGKTFEQDLLAGLSGLHWIRGLYELHVRTAGIHCHVIAYPVDGHRTSAESQ